MKDMQSDVTGAVRDGHCSRPGAGGLSLGLCRKQLYWAHSTTGHYL